MAEKGTTVLSIDPLVILDHYEIDYRHSYAQDSPFFIGLSKGKLLGSRCKECEYVFATPRADCMECGGETDWHELPLTGRIHSYTTCYYSGELFLGQTPFMLALIEFDGADTLFMSRLRGVKPDEAHVGMPVVAKFARTPSFRITDVWFEPVKAGARLTGSKTPQAVSTAGKGTKGSRAAGTRAPGSRRRSAAPDDTRSPSERRARRR
ncbi:MAG: Zn-ribbon domain-containing OB-fold protein [Chloroflexi bacterium]|nr:Zn-ribbon domain-containing OB-fold protein [Chloroflexota bacterium]